MFIGALGRVDSEGHFAVQASQQPTLCILAQQTTKREGEGERERERERGCAVGRSLDRVWTHSSLQQNDRKSSPALSSATGRHERWVRLPALHCEALAKTAQTVSATVITVRTSHLRRKMVVHHSGQWSCSWCFIDFQLRDKQKNKITIFTWVGRGRHQSKISGLGP